MPEIIVDEEMEVGPVTPPIVAVEEGKDKDRLTDFLSEPQRPRHPLEFFAFYD